MGSASQLGGLRQVRAGVRASPRVRQRAAQRRGTSIGVGIALRPGPSGPLARPVVAVSPVPTQVQAANVSGGGEDPSVYVPTAEDIELTWLVAEQIQDWGGALN